jgi:hypothetical protein
LIDYRASFLPLEPEADIDLVSSQIIADIERVIGEHAPLSADQESGSGRAPEAAPVITEPGLGRTHRWLIEQVPSQIRASL